MAKFAMLADTVSDIAVEIIEVGRRSHFNVSNLDSYLASPNLLPEAASD